MKWTLRKSGFEGRWAPGGGWMRGREPGNGVLAPQRSPLLFTYLPPSPSHRNLLKSGRVALATTQINIISIINIKSTLLCFASGTKPNVARRPCPDRLPFPSFLSSPPSLAIYRDHNLLWWVFRVLFCQGQSGLSNKWSQWSGSGSDTATFPSIPSQRVTHVAKIHFWKFHIYCIFPWLLEKQGRRNKKAMCLQGQTGVRVKLNWLCRLLSFSASPSRVR